MNRVCDDNNLIHVRKTDSLINTTSYGEKFGFSRHDVDHMMYSLDDWVVITINVDYQHNNLILDACIYYNNY